MNFVLVTVDRIWFMEKEGGREREGGGEKGRKREGGRVGERKRICHRTGGSLMLYALVEFNSYLLIRIDRPTTLW